MRRSKAELVDELLRLCASATSTAGQEHPQLRSILHAAPIGIGLVVDRVLHQVNDRFCTMLGYARGELVGQSARVLYPSQEEYDHVGVEKYRQIARHGVGTVETRLRRKDGEILDVLLSSAPVDPGDLLSGVSFTAVDVSDYRRLERALARCEQELAAARAENEALRRR